MNAGLNRIPLPQGAASSAPPVVGCADQVENQQARLHTLLTELEKRLDQYLSPTDKASETAGSAHEAVHSSFHERVMMLRNEAIRACDRVQDILDRLSI